MGFIILAACVSWFRSFRSFWSHPTSPSDGRQTRLLALWRNPKWR